MERGMSSVERGGEVQKFSPPLFQDGSKRKVFLGGKRKRKRWAFWEEREKTFYFCCAYSSPLKATVDLNFLLLLFRQCLTLYQATSDLQWFIIQRTPLRICSTAVLIVMRPSEDWGSEYHYNVHRG